MRIICLVLGHRYGVEQRVGDEPVHWECRRCGFQRFTPPTDMPPGSHPQSPGG